MPSQALQADEQPYVLPELPDTIALARVRAFRDRASLRRTCRHFSGDPVPRAIIETAIVFFAGQALETAAADSARLIMTGQAQTAGYDKTKFKEAVCAKIYGLFDCNAGLHVDVKSYASFASVPPAKPITNGNLDTNTSYAPGTPGDIVVVKLMYQWPVYVSLLGLNLSDLSGGKRLLMSTVAFRNEPYK